MIVSALPSSPEAFAKAAWDDIAPYYDELTERPLEPDTIEAWLHAWSTLEELLTEAAARAMIAYTIDTGDAEKEADHLRFSSDILPRAEERSVALAKRLVESGYSRPDLDTTIQRFRTSIEIFREANVPLFAEIEQHCSTYQRITGSMTAEWEGEQRPLPQLLPFLKSPDRAVRERAWRASTKPYLAHRSAMADLFDRMYALRQQVARNAGFANFRDYIFPAKFRFDYTPADCERFHDAVEQSRRASGGAGPGESARAAGAGHPAAMGPAGRSLPRARFAPSRTAEELVARARRVFGGWLPSSGPSSGHDRSGLLDLESRKGKAPGGYCETLHFQGRPFIFMNAVGVADDVNTLAARGRARFSRVRIAPAAVHLAAASRSRSGGAGVDVDGAARGTPPRSLRPATTR